jgi:diadenosine tetraphosphatase ApaH/serine/threonine PP2A family protein phosphatase
VKIQLPDPSLVVLIGASGAPLWTDRRVEHGPFDVIGDVHGCHAELTELLRELGYAVAPDGFSADPPEGRRAVFVGDYGDGGPDTPAVLKLVMSMAASGTAICLPGNHDVKLARKLNGRNVQITHGLAETLEQLDSEPAELRERARDFLDGLVSHAALDDGALVVAHAGLKRAYQGRSSARVRDFALYGETTGETDEFGLPVRGQWASDYRGSAAAVYGYTPVAEPEWLNNTINIDSGCVFGGRLTALHWPERELVSVPAQRTYYEPAKPFLAPEDTAPAAAESRPALLLDVEDVSGKRIIQTRLTRTITVREEKRRGGAGGDEPLRDRPEMARISAADDGADRHLAARGSARASRERVRRIPLGGSAARDLRGEAHGLTGDRRRLPRRRCGEGALRRRSGADGRDLHADRPTVPRWARGHRGGARPHS